MADERMMGAKIIGKIIGVQTIFRGITYTEAEIIKWHWYSDSIFTLFSRHSNSIADKYSTRKIFSFSVRWRNMHVTIDTFAIIDAITVIIFSHLICA